jgi:hypothetical protein
MDKKEECKCTICKAKITDKKDVGYEYDFRRQEYTDKIICLNCDEDQNDEMGDYLAGDDW